jgi:methylmalonyl-CoA mutase
LTAVPLCDGHDSAITTVNLELVKNGWEVVYLGYHQAASAIARAAVQVIERLRARGAKDIKLFGGGGGTITAQDEKAMRRAGVRRIFFPGTPLSAMMAALSRDVRPAPNGVRRLRGDRAIGRAITLAETSTKGSKSSAAPRARRRMLTVGVAGPGGAGKSTLIDELTSRFLRSIPAGRVAILANDPSHPGVGGALLGDRVSAIYSDDDRVFFRSLATRGSLTGVSSAVPAALELLEASGQFDLVFVESVGIGQESDPFGVLGSRRRLVDLVLFVLSPHYGGRIQLQKIPLLTGADLAVLNKCDDPRATSAKAEISALLAENARTPALHGTMASKHDDASVDALFAAILERGRARARSDEP